MCGFVGFMGGTLGDARRETIQVMSDTIAHRGPDSEGHYHDDEFSVGFRRLSIIDLSEEASQPMHNEDGTITLVFNGEIYNFEALRATLLEKGHVFHSHTDSEVLIHGYEQYGTDILKHLRGMFAFAIWDAPKKRLFIARDFFGIKPLYYTRNTEDGAFLFGSEIKSFLKYPGFNKAVNPDALRAYLMLQYSGGDETFFKGVYKLRPAHYLLLENGETSIVPYWHNTYSIKEGSLKHSIDQINDVMRESVAYHKISDVKVGAFLSGGIDSSYVTALMGPNETFSVGFSDYEDMFDETKHAQALSEILGMQNHRKMISAQECFDKLPTIQYHMDEPQSNPSSVPLYFLAQLARKHVTVVLSGEGADEIFGGYVWYEDSKAADFYEKLPRTLRKTFRKAAEALPQNRATRFFIRGGMPVEERFVGQARVFEDAEALQVLKPDYRKGPSAFDLTAPIYKSVKGEDDLTKMQYLDLHLWLPGDILLKADKMSMAHSLELRVPFLDKEVMKVASALPKKHRVEGKETKKALRAAALSVLPEEWAKRPKVGFPVPIRHWMREEKYYKLIKERFESTAAAQFFEVPKLLEYLDGHYSGKGNYARQIWTVYVFLTWYGVFFEDFERA